MKETSKFMYLFQSAEYKDVVQSIMTQKMQNF
jgi:hypothetical protein